MSEEERERAGRIDKEQAEYTARLDAEFAAGMRYAEEAYDDA